MGERYLGSGDPLSDDELSLDVQPDRYTAFKFVFTASAKTGETIQPRDVFEFVFSRFSNPQMDADSQHIFELGDQTWGAVEKTQTSGGAHRIVFALPFFHPLIPNALHVMSENEVDASVQFKDISTLADSASLKVQGITTDDYFEQYQLKFKKAYLDFSGAAEQSISIPDPRVMSLYLLDNDTIFKNGNGAIRVQKSNFGSSSWTTPYERTNWDDLLDTSNLSQKLESPSPMMELPIVDQGSLSKAKNKVVKVTGYPSGGGTLYGHYAAVSTKEEDSNRERSRKLANDQGGVTVPNPAGSNSV